MVMEKNIPPKQTRKKNKVISYIQKKREKKKKRNVALIIEILTRVFCAISKIG